MLVTGLAAGELPELFSEAQGRSLRDTRPMRGREIIGAVIVALAAGAPPAAGQTPSLSLSAPAVRATGVAIPVRAQGAAPGARVTLERRGRRGWVAVATNAAGADGGVRFAYRPYAIARRYRLRVSADGVVSEPRTVRTRHVSLAAFGDANLGDGVATVMAARGATWPWGAVAPALRRADIAFGNLECAVSWRGAPVPKEYNFRGSPRALRRIVRFTGIDALNLANNHVGDYGTAALLDTVRHVRGAGVRAIGAGATLAAARRSRVVRRLGLRVAFVGFSDVNPAGFAAGPGRPGTAFADPAAIRVGVRAAKRRADVVVATFHWGVERAPRENARQRAFARTALAAGAAAVIGAHPHVLQPIRRQGRRLVAYSLGNFVWSAGSAATTRTGLLHLRLSARGVERSRLQPARIVATRPRLRQRAT